MAGVQMRVGYKEPLTPATCTKLIAFDAIGTLSGCVGAQNRFGPPLILVKCPEIGESPTLRFAILVNPRQKIRCFPYKTSYRKTNHVRWAEVHHCPITHSAESTHPEPQSG